MRGQTRNIETFKVGSGAKMNEFEFHKHQGEMHDQRDEREQGGNKSETTAERVARLTREAHEKVLRRKKKR
jgi:hypothetical protein